MYPSGYGYHNSLKRIMHFIIGFAKKKLLCAFDKDGYVMIPYE